MQAFTRLATAALVLAAGAVPAWSQDSNAAATTPPAPAAQPAPADASPLTIELNKLEPRDSACRAYVVLGNPGGPDITDLKLDLILFGTDQVIQKRVAVSVAPVPKSKTTVKLFDIDGQDCTKIGSILINEVISCAGAQGPIAACEARIEPSSRAGAKLFK